ncbi:hypothetical protein ACFWB1_23790 [Streptomyces goshikiensis]|uniref:hypothetical protein n=1 Tax=Streptomyces goshikiensis TaxID=1942 RepID=UPI00367E6A0D
MTVAHASSWAKSRVYSSAAAAQALAGGGVGVLLAELLLVLLGLQALARIALQGRQVVAGERDGDPQRTRCTWTVKCFSGPPG